MAPTSIKVGASVVTFDGTTLGKVKEVANDSFKLDVRFAPDYWLAMSYLAREYIDNLEEGTLRLIVSKNSVGRAKLNPQRVSRARENLGAG